VPHTAYRVSGLRYGNSLFVFISELWQRSLGFFDIVKRK